MNSVFLVVAIATLFAIALPNATDFVWLFYKVYLAMAMGYFVDLTMAWYGGESEMLRLVGEGTEINLRTPPCCCCFCICPKPLPFTKQRIQILRGSVYQVSHYWIGRQSTFVWVLPRFANMKKINLTLVEEVPTLEFLQSFA